jgi:hypothetical protein
MKFAHHYGKLSLALLLASTFLLIYLTDRYILTAGFYKANGHSLSVIPNQNGHVLEAMQKWVYLSSAVYLVLKLCVITVILHTAYYLRDQRVAIGSIFKAVVLADFVFLIPAALKLISFNYTFPQGTLLDWHGYYVLSALSLFHDVPGDWYYALQSLNLFEVGYWFALALGLSRITGSGFAEALKTVVCSYVPALAVWIVSVTFFTLTMFPATG